MNFKCVCNCVNFTDPIQFGCALAAIDMDEIYTELEYPWPTASSISNSYIKDSLIFDDRSKFWDLCLKATSATKVLFAITKPLMCN